MPSRNQEPGEPGRPAEKSPRTDKPRIPDRPVLVVGIGARAEDLDLLRKLFADLPTGQGLAVVLVQHVTPSQVTLNVNTFKNHTALKILEATDGLPAEADHLYLIPPDRHLNIAEGRLSLAEPVYCHGLCLPIDHFFCSLAIDQKTRAVGIVLSGTGSDGTIGLSEIKASGGRTIVEDRPSAGSPDQSGPIPANVADRVLPVEKIPEALLTWAARSDNRNSSGETGELEADYMAILNLLHTRTGHDFRCYKKNTLIRRINRRLALHQLHLPAEYLAFMESHPDEARQLQKDLLIGVTDFFRQPEAWRTLEEQIIPDLIARAGPENPTRVWIPGCSTGKEAYSLAILLAEKVEASGKPIGIQIFATDTDEDALNIARSGIYPEGDLGSNISPVRQKKFFARDKGQFQVTKAIRELVVFAPQNLTTDPPFSRLDLIICRNLLIYLDREVQRQIIALFHFALREGGYLFLGNAETISDHQDLFEPVFKKWRVYRRIGVGRRMPLELPLGKTAEHRISAPFPARLNSLTFIAQHVLVDRFAPTAVIIDRRQQLLYAHGATEDYLTIPRGEPTMDIVGLAREGLRLRLGAAIRMAIKENRTTGITTRLKRGAQSVPVRVTVTPLHHPREMDGLLLISFEDYIPPAGDQTAPEQPAAGENGWMQLEDELKITREELQSTIEQLESSNEELKASTEEAIASNEELQSVNEELETSKEELQSLNEELNIINTRLQEKVEELENANNDVNNLLSSTHIATVFLDRTFRVKRYTPAITGLLSLIPSDVGRPMEDITFKFKDEDLLAHARRVLADLTPIAKEVQAENGRWYIRRITPYRTHDDRIEGVVVTFLDVDEIKQAEAELTRVASFPMLNPNPVTETDMEGRMHFLNPSARRLFPDLEQKGADHPWLGDWASIAHTCRESGGNLSVREVTVGERVYYQTMYCVQETQRIRIYGIDITEHNRAEVLLSENENRLKRAQEIAHLGSWELDLVGNVLTWSDEVYRIFGLQPQEFAATYEAFLEAIDPDDRQAVNAAYSGSLREGRDSYEIEHRIVRKSTGETRYVHERCEHVKDETGLIIRSVGMVHDITEHKLADEALLRAKEEWERTFDSVPDLIAILDDQHRVIRVNKAMADRLGASPSACLGQHCYEVVHGLEAPPAFCPHAKTLLDGLEHVEELHEGHLGGDFLVSTTPVIDARGQLIGSVHVARDITDRKKMEDKLRRSRDDLEIRVRERTAELALANEGLIIEIAERQRAEEALLESEKQLRFLAAKILTSQENERKRIALDVHDILGSSLSAIKFKVEEVLYQIPEDQNPNICKPLEVLIPVIQETIEAARRIQSDLRPPLLDDLGVLATFSWFCRRFQTIYSNIRIEQTITILEEEVPDPLKIGIFRITQEAMNNIVKHAQADIVHLGLRKVDGALELTIQDNGKGFDPESLSIVEGSKKGLGLSSMKERTQFSGGLFFIESTPGKGTVIKAQWPV